jgi:hypothetical protein
MRTTLLPVFGSFAFLCCVNDSIDSGLLRERPNGSDGGLGPNSGVASDARADSPGNGQGDSTTMPVTAEWLVGIGGDGDESVTASAVDPVSNDVWITGTFTIPLNLGCPNGPLLSRGGTDIFVIRLSAAAGACVTAYSLGGRENEYASSLAIGPDGTVAVGGQSASETVTDASDAQAYRLNATARYPKGIVLAWNSKTGKLTRAPAPGTENNPGSSNIRAIAFSANGKLYAAGSATTYADKGAVSVAFDATTVALASTLPGSSSAIGRNVPLIATYNGNATATHSSHSLSMA